MNKKIDHNAVAARYNSLSVIWTEDDKWHLKTKERIDKFIKSVFHKLSNSNSFKILNAGSAGYSYGLEEKNILHVDIADKHVAHLSNGIVANVEDLPLQNEQYDMVICVGSVLNYCDPIKVINEFSRVLKKKSYIILEFESSKTFEIIGEPQFNQNAAIVETIFGEGETEKLWYFSEKYIKRIMKSNNFYPILRRRTHIISPLFLKWGINENEAVKWSILDGVLSFIPFLNRFCSNVIYLFQRS